MCPFFELIKGETDIKKYRNTLNQRFRSRKQILKNKKIL